MDIYHLCEPEILINCLLGHLSRLAPCFILLFLFNFPLTLSHAVDELSCRSELSAERSEELLSAVEKRYDQFNDLDARFIQRSYFLGLGKQEVSDGQVRFRKPGMMDWLYEKGEKQQFISDGKTFWFYQPDLNQVTLIDFKQSFNSELPVSFLLGVGKLREKFKLLKACEASAGTTFELQAKEPDPNLSEFVLLVDPQSKLPKGARVVDIGGNETTIIFEQIQLNRGIKADHFAFNIPRGVDVIDKRGKGLGLSIQ